MAGTAAMIAPMLATLAEAPLVDPALVYEPKYDGIRAIAEVARGRPRGPLWSRLGNDKTAQFPEVVRALAAWARRRREPVVLDGEIVALDAEGRPAGFQQLQGRIHVKGGRCRRPVRSPSSRSTCCAIGDATCASCRSPARRARSSGCSRRSRSPLLRLERAGCAATAARCTQRALGAAAGKASSPSARRRRTARASGRPTGAS